MCLILNLVYLVSQASQPATAIQVKTLFRINCRFSFQNSVSFSRSLSPGELGLSGKKSYHFRLPLSGALLYYHTPYPSVNTFFTLFFAFFRLFFKSETSAFLPDGTFGFGSVSCVCAAWNVLFRASFPMPYHCRFLFFFCFSTETVFDFTVF